MSENFELRIQRLENSVSARFIEQKAASDHATQRFNRLIDTLADASVDLKEHQEKLETVPKGILTNSQADVFNTKETLSQIRTNISCKGSVDTTINGVDTMAQSKCRNVKKRSTSVDTSPGQVDTKVDTKYRQVDTREPSQKACFAVWDMVSTLDHLRSTLETSPRELICQSGTVCRHTSWAGRHTPESL
ncbi:hypothetical protein Taro_036687 [Colocasia esculenta]|uniref:Uncharacterized protein n=1 Tax=Colocasia esculenta TaxID=4460 RepID=A0A843WE33_COLES|nr:hypothetical protein [Colocasia esculenta]